MRDVLIRIPGLANSGAWSFEDLGAQGEKCLKEQAMSGHEPFMYLRSRPATYAVTRLLSASSAWSCRFT